jgi:hypothetical protein
MKNSIADPFTQVLVPRLFSHLSQPGMKTRLRNFFAWGYSFEQWLKWETVVALDPVVAAMRGDPWDYCQWELEYHGFKRQLGIVDMAFLGARPLMLHLKVFTRWSFDPGHVAGKPNSLLHDIKRVRAFKNPQVTAATLLLLLEHAGQRADLAKLGVAEPENPRGPRILLGKVNCWKTCTPEKVSNVYAKLLYWTNRQRAKGETSS